MIRFREGIINLRNMDLIYDWPSGCPEPFVIICKILYSQAFFGGGG